MASAETAPDSRLPKKYRNMLPELTVDQHGNLEFRINGKNLDEPSQARPTARDLVREFRSDPSQGTDLTRRFQDMGVESVDAQVIFPNIGLTCSMGNQPADFYHTWARTYNDWVFELFESNKERLKPAAMLAVDDLDDLLVEANGGGSYTIKPLPGEQRSIDIGDYYGDISKIRDVLGWQPRVALRDALVRTMAYFRKYLGDYI